MTMSDYYPPAPEAPRPRKASPLLLGGLGGLAALCLCVCSLGALVWLDPLGWQLVERVLGTADPLAQAVPADSAMYMSANLLKLTSGDTARLVKVLAEASGAEDVDNTDDWIGQLDEGRRLHRALHRGG
jgi:hypothetical protein